MPRHSHSHGSRFTRGAHGSRQMRMYALITIACLAAATLIHAASIMAEKADEYAQMAVQSAVNRQVSQAIEGQRPGR